MKSSQSAGWLALLSGCVAGSVSVGHAQARGPAGDPSAGPSAQWLEEIVVTARKREESVQDVPVAVSVLSEEQLKIIGADDFEGFARTVPGLNFNKTGPGDMNVNIRGVSTGAFRADLNQSTVAFYVDDLPTMDSFFSLFTLDPRLPDINRVEVLRGPQGTLFGSGSLSGAVRIITNKPDLTKQEFELEAGAVSIDKGDVGYSTSGMANIPLMDGRFAVRAVGFWREDPGYVDNVGTGEKDSNHGDVWGGRVMARLQATDSLQVTGTLTRQSTKNHDSPATFRFAADGGTYERLSYLPNSADIDITSYNLVADYDFGAATLTSSSTYGELSGRQYRDAVTRYFRLLLGVPNLVVPDTEFQATDIYAQELRLASNSAGRLKYVIGAFYMKRDSKGGQDFFFQGVNPLPGVTLADVDVDHTTKEQALFGELTFGLTERIELTAGARAFKNEYHIATTSAGMLAGLPPGVIASNTLSSDDDGINPKASLSYKVSADKLLYATAAKGYRTGFINLQLGSLQPSPYDPDTLWNYELGYKSYLFDRRLMFNMAAYYIDWKDIQTTAIRTVNGFTVQGTTNAGDASTYGVEVETAWQPTRHWLLSTAFSVGDTELKSIQSDVAIASQPRLGSELPAVPNFSIASALQYSFDGADWGSYVRLEHQYVGRSLSTFETAPANPQPVPMGDYDLVNLRVGYTRGNLEIVGYVENLLGSEGVQVATQSQAIPPTFASAILVTPRQIGTTVRIKF